MRDRVRWRVLSLPPLAQWREVMAALEVGPEAALAYWHRGFRRKEDLDPPLALLPLKGLREAAALLEEALRQGKRIRVHGDYDADGLTGTAILVRGLAALGADVHPFIPHRLEEGYGVLMERVPEHLEASDLFLTVDCGITNHAELRELLENGVEVIVTDHHTPGKTPPPGLVVHPALTPDLKEKPTGAGVAFLLLWALHERLGLPPPLEYADLAAVGTIADVAPLWGWNRALVKEGLARIPASSWVGLRLLAEAVGYTGKAVEVAFRIAPRINAASRLGEAEKALRLLLTDDAAEAQALVGELHRLNARRQTLEEAMLRKLLPQADPEAKAIVLLDPEGHPGVMGIVASRILEATLRPVFLVAQGKGTVRSLAPISAVEALRSAEDLLLRYGGHKEAAGFAMDEALFPAFKARVEAYALEAWEALGEVPKGLSARLLAKLEEKPLDGAFARRVAELEAVTRHDLVAFTRALAEWTGDEEVGRYLHLGLTSSDIVDTACAVQNAHGIGAPGSHQALGTFQHFDKAGVAHGEVLGAVVKAAELSAPGGHAPAGAPAFFEHRNAVARLHQRARAGYTGNAGTDHGDVALRSGRHKCRPGRGA